jgi:hypothetical protein
MRSLDQAEQDDCPSDRTDDGRQGHGHIAYEDRKNGNPEVEYKIQQQAATGNPSIRAQITEIYG